jgi:signal peptide peptidase SppA
MAKPSLLSRLIPLRFQKSVPVVTHVALNGAIGIGTPLRPAITFKSTAELLAKAFSRKGIAGVAISVNSPGGSPVQSAMIHSHIRALADEHKVPVFVFCEDVAASGGYWLACAGDEIYADQSSIIGSIGVISAGFGFVEAINKLGVERRVHAAGDSKSMLDPFKPERPEDVAHLQGLQTEVHDAFKALLRNRRGSKLNGIDSELFSGAFWSGRTSLKLGLIDGLGHLNPVLKAKFGDKLVIRKVEAPQGWGLKRLGFGALSPDFAASALESIETRALWARFGL